MVAYKTTPLQYVRKLLKTHAPPHENTLPPLRKHVDPPRENTPSPPNFFFSWADFLLFITYVRHVITWLRNLLTWLRNHAKCL